MKSAHKQHFMSAILWVVILPGWAGLHAQEIPAELTINRLIELAIETDVRLLPKRNALQMAQLRQDEPILWADPELRVGTDLNLNRRFINTAVRIYPPNPWQREAEQLEKTSQTSLAQADCQIMEAQTAMEIYRLYREIQCSEKEIELAARLTTVKKEMAAIADRQVKASVETSGGALRYHWELREAQQVERELRQTHQLLKNKLATQTGLAIEEISLPPLNPKEPLDAIDPDTRIESAIAGRPDLQLLQAQLQLTDAQLKQVGAEQRLWFDHVQAGYSEESDAWDIQVAIRIPIFSRKSTKKYQILTDHTLKQTVLLLSEQTIAIQIREAVTSFASAVEELTIYQTELADLNEETSAEIEKLKKFAPSSPMEWIKLEEWLIKADSRQLQLLRNIYSAQATLFSLTGQTSFTQNQIEIPAHETIETE